MRNPKQEFSNQMQQTTDESTNMDTNFEKINENNSKELTESVVNNDDDITKNKQLSNNCLTQTFESIRLDTTTTVEENKIIDKPMLCDDDQHHDEISKKNENSNHQQSKKQITPTSIVGVNLSNLINRIECDIKSDTSSNLINLNLSKSTNLQQNAINRDREDVECKTKRQNNNFDGNEGIIMPPQPLHPDTYLNFPHYIDYNNFSTNYNHPLQNATSANNTNIKNASSALALFTTNNDNSSNSSTTNNCNKQSLSLNNISDTIVNNTIVINNKTTPNSSTNTMGTLVANDDEINKKINPPTTISSPQPNLNGPSEIVNESLTTSLTNTTSPTNVNKETFEALNVSSKATAESISISLTDQSSINDDKFISTFQNQNQLPKTTIFQNSNLPQSPTTSIVVEPPSISVTIHHSSQPPLNPPNTCTSSSSNCNYSNPFNSPASASASASATVLQMQKSTSQQLTASNASNASPLKFQDNLLAYKRYLFSPKTQSLDLGSDLEHPAVMRNRNPRLQLEERYDDDSLILNEVDELMIVKNLNQNNLKNENSSVNSSTINATTTGIMSSNGDLRREILQRTALNDEALNAGRLSPSPFYTTSSASNHSTMSTGESDAASYNTTTSSTSSNSETSILKPKNIQTALESRPIYPNVPYSPYSSPRTRRRPPLRESRKVSIDKSGSFLQLNQYKLMDQIGQGSYGLVKLAYNEEDSSHYAMKILSKRRLLRKAGLMSRGPKKTTQSPLDRVYREIAVLKKLDHPNVVKLIEVLDDPLEDFLYLVFELVHQGEVLAVPTDKALNEERAWSVFRDALLGLEYLHYQRIIHSDIKPGNLLLGECGQVKIADLGVCNEFLGEDAAMNNGSTAGTPAFRAPETLKPGQHVYSGKAADIWALGATLWSLIYGNVPFVANNIPALYEQIKNDALIFPENPTICDELKDLLERILDKDPNKRITLPQIKEHPWVTSNGKYPLPSEDENCRLVQVSDEDINSVVKSIPKLDTLILIKTMLKNHSFQNPFARGISGRAPQRGGSRLERFTRAGRSNSAPGAYHSPLDRQLSSENTLPSLSENVVSPTNESSEKIE